MSALVLGAVLAAAALAFVMWPLFRGPPTAGRGRSENPGLAQDSAVRALREIEFDRATGKLSDADYAQLKADFTVRAVADLRAADLAATATTDADRAELMIQRARGAAITCRHCSAVCPEPDALYCSSCGTYLAQRCGKCEAVVTEAGARFCTACGWELAA